MSDWTADVQRRPQKCIENQTKDTPLPSVDPMAALQCPPPPVRQNGGNLKPIREGLSE